MQLKCYVGLFYADWNAEVKYFVVNVFELRIWIANIWNGTLMSDQTNDCSTCCTERVLIREILNSLTLVVEATTAHKTSEVYELWFHYSTMIFWNLTKKKSMIDMNYQFEWHNSSIYTARTIDHHWNMQRKKMSSLHNEFIQTKSVCERIIIILSFPLVHYNVNCRRGVARAHEE